MATKITSRDFDAPIKTYTFDNYEYNALRVSVNFRKSWFNGYFYATLSPEKIERNDGYCVRGCAITGTRDPLGSWIDVQLKDASRNSQKVIDELSSNLEQASEAIGALFDLRDWDNLKWLVKAVAEAGYKSDIRQRVEELTKSSTNNQSTTKTEETMETNNQNLQQYVGKTIIVGNNIAKIIIKSADGDILQGEFQKEGAPAFPLPFKLDDMNDKIASGVWKFEDVTSNVEETPADEQPQAEAPKVKPRAAKAETAEEEVDEVDEVEDTAETVSDDSPVGEDNDDPLVVLYNQLKQEKPEHVILFRCNGVYCAIKDDAQIVAEAMHMEVTAINGYSFALVKNEMLTQVVRTLVGKGVKVAVQDAPADKEEKTAEPSAEPQQRVKPRVKPRSAASDDEDATDEVEEAAPADDTTEETTETPADNTADSAPEEENTEESAPKAAPRSRLTDVTVAPEAGTPRIIKATKKSIIVTGEASRIEAVLHTLWARKVPYTSKGVTYSGIQLSARHTDTVKEIIKLAYSA